MHFTLKTSSLQRSDLDEFVKNYNPENRHNRKATWKAELDSGSGAGMTEKGKKKQNPPSPQSSPTRGEEEKNEGRWRSYNYDELVNRDKASLDIFWLKDESLEASDNLPDPDVIAQEIVEDLEAALEQFREIANDLGSRGDAEGAEKS
jgi:type I restriction enzyme M protein